MKKLLFLWLILLGNLLHIYFFSLNEVMKIADSFAYLQMAHHLKNFSLEGFWNGWFWFLYSVPIAFFGSIIENDMLASFVGNIVLFNFLILIAYLFWKSYLSPKYLFAFVGFLFFSPILLHYNIHILSENLYIPLFFLLFIAVLQYKHIPTAGNMCFIGLFVWLLYITRAEAFIYLGSIGLILAYLWIKKENSFGKTLHHGIMILLWFFIIALPYIAYMNSFTWEWWLTNKGSSNLRQAELRWVSKMDDDGFEQAVWELRPDNLGLIAWFAGGLKYEKPTEWESFKNYMLSDPQKVIHRISENQLKLYWENLPHIIVWNAYKLFHVEWSTFYKNIFFMLLLSIPIIFMIWWIIALIRNGESFLVITFLSFFWVASLFFTLFFVLDRYFVIFVPFFLFFFVYWLQSWNIKNIFWEWGKYLWISGVFAGIFALGILSYYNTFKWEDAKYEVKKEAGIYLKEYHFSGEHLKIMERFPVVTYYAGSWERWLTPYTNKLENLLIYARHHSIDYLVVDSIDFARYRPDLDFLLHFPDETYPWLQKLKTFEKNGETVILYKIVK